MKKAKCFVCQNGLNVQFDGDMKFQIQTTNASADFTPDQTKGLICHIVKAANLSPTIEGLELKSASITWLRYNNDWLAWGGAFNLKNGADEISGEIGQNESGTMTDHFFDKLSNEFPERNHNETMVFEYVLPTGDVQPSGGIIIAVVSTCGGGEADK